MAQTVLRGIVSGSGNARLDLQSKQIWLGIHIFGNGFKDLTFFRSHIRAAQRQQVNLRDLQ